jgi:hypothetical protein
MIYCFGRNLSLVKEKGRGCTRNAVSVAVMSLVNQVSVMGNPVLFFTNLFFFLISN